MPTTRRRSEPFNLGPVGAAMPAPLAAMILPPMESLLCLSKLNEVYGDVVAEGPPEDFCGAVLARLGVSMTIRDEDLARVPATGSALVVANHPFGGVEGLMMMHVLRRVRPDVKVLVNYLLGCVPELRELCIFVNPFETDGARRSNVKGLIEALEWLRGGGMLGVFPSGTVAYYSLQTREIADPPWSPNIAALARKSGTRVVPMFFAGANGPMFHLAGLIHPRLRTALLPRELVRRRKTPVQVQLGAPIQPQALASFATNEEAIEYLRLRTQALAGRDNLTARGRRPRAAKRKLPTRAPKPPVFPAVDPAVAPATLAAEIAELPAEALLSRQGNLAVYQVSAGQVPNLLRELGRLRELSFREIGEGTGKRLDLDEFDRWYQHLLLWDHGRNELIGAYRLGLTDRILPTLGQRGLYVSTLFHFNEELLHQLGPSIELGRSFVRPEHQMSLGPMMMLWTGIGQFFARFPHYRHMIGPVSISSRYSTVSRALMVAFLSQPERLSPLAALVRPKRPFLPRKFAPLDLLRHVRLLRDVDELNRLVGDVEPDGKGVPGLLKQYLKLGAKALTFSVDPAFGYCVDAFCVFDALATDRRTLRRFLGEQHIDRFFAAHGRTPPPDA